MPRGKVHTNSGPLKYTLRNKINPLLSFLSLVPVAFLSSSVCLSIVGSGGNFSVPVACSSLFLWFRWLPLSVSWPISRFQCSCTFFAGLISCALFIEKQKHGQAVQYSVLESFFESSQLFRRSHFFCTVLIQAKRGRTVHFNFKSY